jgi:hypothetical protein
MRPSGDGDPVLVITNPKDPHSDAVIHFLYKMGVDVVRFHAGETHLDSFVVLDASGGTVHIESSGRTFQAHNIRSCWYRRPDPVDIHAQIYAYPDRQLIVQETDAVLWGLYGCINTVWYSHPYCLRRAAWKIYQLNVAKRIGFHVPSYVVSNQPSILQDFLDAHEYVVLKPINEKTTCVEIDGQPMSFYVKKFSKKQLASLVASKPQSPCFLQRYVDKECDVRVTVIGRLLYAVRIEQPANKDEVVDWRPYTLELKHDLVPCPAEITSMILGYMTHMKLNFAAFDFVIDKMGRWSFLECNPNGQWLWIEIKTGLNLAEIFAEHLALKRPPLVTDVL